MEENTGRSSDMDAVLAYRNYLAAEDHLDELLHRASTLDEKLALEGLMEDTIALRENIMPAEADATRHCLVKHYAAGYEAVRERWKDTRTEQDWWNKKYAYDLLITALEMLWGRKIILCERCDYERDNADGGASSTGEPGHGRSRHAVSSASVDREPSISSLQEASSDGDKVSLSGGGTGEGESGTYTVSDGDSSREDDTD